MMVKLEMIPLEYIDFTRNTHASPDVMLEKISTIIGALMKIENCQMHGQVSQDSLFQVKNHRTKRHGPGGD